MDEAGKAQAQGAPLSAASFFAEERLRPPPKSPPPRNGNFGKPPPERMQAPPKSPPPRDIEPGKPPIERLRPPPKSPAPSLETISFGRARRRIPVFQRSYACRGRLARAALRALDLAGEALFAKARERPSEVHRVLLMRPDNMGGVVCALPAVRAVRERLPDAHIDLLIGASARPLFIGLEKELAGVDFLVFNASWLQGPPGGGKFGLRSAARLRQLLKLRMAEIGGPYDLAVDFRGDFQSILAARLAGARYLVGRGLGGGGFCLDAEAGEIPGRHHVERNLDLLECAGLGRFETRNPALALSEEETAQAWACVSSLAEYDAEALIGIHPDAGGGERIWRPELYGELISRLVSDLSARVLLLGGAADREVIDAILASIKGVRARGSVVDMGEKVQGLRTLMGVMKCCRLYIGGDSDPTHVAAALGVPAICVFQGQNEPREWGPRGSNVVVLRKRPASGGGSRAGAEKRELERVFEAARRCV